MQPMGKTMWGLLKTLNMELPFDPVRPPLGIESKNPKTPTRKNIHNSMFTAAPFTKDMIRKQPKGPPVGPWVKRCGTFTQWTLPCGAAWRSLHVLLLSNRSQPEKHRYPIISLSWK